MKYLNWSLQLWLGIIILILSSLLGLSIPLLLRAVIDGGMVIGFKMFIIIMLTFLLQAILVSAGSYLLAIAGEEVVASTRKDITSHLIQNPLSFFDSQKSGDLSSRVINDSNTLRQFTVETLPNLVTSIITLVGTLVILFILDWKLSCAFIVTFPLLFLVITPVSHYSETFSAKLQEHMSRLTGDLAEHFKEITLIKSNCAEQAVTEHINQRIEAIKKNALKADMVEALSSPFVLLLLFASIAIIFTYGGQRVSSADLTIGTLISFLIYLFQLLNPIGTVAGVFNDFARVKGATHTLAELLQLEQENFQTGLKKNLSGDIVFADVSFSYGTGLVLEQVNLDIKKGQTVAFVGPSGSGKTTLVYLLMRFYPLTAGKIYWAGTDISELNLAHLRERIAFISQQSALLSGTIRENLVFGLSTMPTETELRQALSFADFDKELAHFEEGLDSYIGEGGKLLSGGQRQRLQIARAYLKQADCFIFDEATSNLDADTEYAVSQGIKQLLKEKTTIVIAHRLSTIIDADRIYFIENHQVTGFGSHEELLANHATYARFVEEQLL